MRRVTPAWQRAFRSCQEHPVRSEEPATAARHNGLSRLQHHHRFHCVRSRRGWSRGEAERETGRGAAPRWVPQFSPPGAGRARRKASRERSVACVSLPGTAALRQSSGRLCVVGVWPGSGIFPAHGKGACSSRGFTLLWGPPLPRWGWGHTEPPKTHPQQVWRGMSPTNAKEGEGETGWI